MRSTRALLVKGAESFLKGKALIEHQPRFCKASPEALNDVLSGDLLFCPDFADEAEAAGMMPEIDQRLRKFRYEDVHVDGVIDGYREVIFTRAASYPSFAAVEAGTVKVVRELMAAPDMAILPAHVLDLSAKGSIRPHVDGKHLSGVFVAGLSLLSTRIVRFRHTQNPNATVDLILPPRSFYMQRYANCLSFI